MVYYPWIYCNYSCLYGRLRSIDIVYTQSCIKLWYLRAIGLSGIRLSVCWLLNRCISGLSIVMGIVTGIVSQTVCTIVTNSHNAENQVPPSMWFQTLWILSGYLQLYSLCWQPESLSWLLDFKIRIAQVIKLGRPKGRRWWTNDQNGIYRQFQSGREVIHALRDINIQINQVP